MQVNSKLQFAVVQLTIQPLFSLVLGPKQQILKMKEPVAYKLLTYRKDDL